MRQTKKGKAWHFGLKLHVGTEKKGLVHNVVVTDAAQADIKQLAHLLHGEERELYDDQAYWSERDRQSFEERGVRYRVNRRPSPTRPLTAGKRSIVSRSRVRARGEHPYHVIRRLWGFTKVRYRGLAKNASRAYALFALSNLYLIRHRLIPRGATCTLQR